MDDDIVVGIEDTVRQPVVTHGPPEGIHEVELGAPRRQRQQKVEGSRPLAADSGATARML